MIIPTVGSDLPQSLDSTSIGAQRSAARDASNSVLERYRRAARRAAPKLAVTTAGTSVEGYWIDPHRYFFLAERYEPTIGRVVSVPSIANCKAERVDEIASLEVLGTLISGYSGGPIELQEWSSAKFDMPDPDTLAVLLGGKYYLIDRHRLQIRHVNWQSDTPALYSPDGRYMCFVRGYNLSIRDRNTGVERSLTQDGISELFYGQPSETCLYALTYRRQPTPFGLWSPDSQWVLTHRIDERAVSEAALIRHAPPGGGNPVLHRFKATTPVSSTLPTATYVAIHVESGRLIEFSEFPTTVVMPYLPFSRIAWFAGTNVAWALRFDRYCQKADLIRLDLESGNGRIAVSECAEQDYLDMHASWSLRPNVRTLAHSDEAIWFSERTGWGHLYLYDTSTGQLKNAITDGECVVRDIVHVDEARRQITLLASGLVRGGSDPARRSLCRANFDGSGFEVLIHHDGDVFVPPTTPYGLPQDRPFRAVNAQPGVSPDAQWCIAQCSSVERGNRTEIFDLQSKRSRVIASAVPGPDDAPVRHVTAVAADGATRLHGVLFLPLDFDAERKYPLIDIIYPGPQVAWQPQSFRAINSSRAESLAALGFVTLMLDTRGVPAGNRAFHHAGYGHLFEPQLADHAAVVRQLCKQYGFLDFHRVGMLGTSAGGTATARALFDYGDIFKVGVSVCGVHDYTFYIAQWSDKYRGKGEQTAWAEQASGTTAHKLQGKLLLISGDMDENVHVNHTLALVDALVRANRDFDMLIVPNEGHSVLLTHGYTQRRVWDYFMRHLMGETPPSNFELKFEPHELQRMSTLLTRENQ